MDGILFLFFSYLDNLFFSCQSFISVSMFHVVLLKIRCELFLLRRIVTDKEGGMLPIFSSPTTRFQATGVGNLP